MAVIERERDRGPDSRVRRREGVVIVTGSTERHPLTDPFGRSRGSFHFVSMNEL